MPTSFSVVLSDDRASEIRRLAGENNLHEGEVLQQLIDIGLADLDEGARV